MLRSGAVVATLATVSLITVVFCGGWQAWARVGAGGLVGLAVPIAVLVGPVWHA